MTRYQLVGLVVVLVSMLGFVVMSTANATEFLLAEWLVAGSKITSLQPVHAEGELIFINKNGGGLRVKTQVLCSGILDGFVGPSSEGMIE